MKKNDLRKLKIISDFAEEYPDFYQEIINLDKYLAQINNQYNSSQEKELLEKITSFRDVILRKQKQITFFGIFKAGKSTFLNAILGRKILPSRTNRATGVITKIIYGVQISAHIILRGYSKLNQLIEFEKLADYILLDTSETIAKNRHNIESVEIKVPLLLLSNNLCLVDTPGLLDNPSLTNITNQQLEKSDLCVIILRADRLLSDLERQAIIRMNNLLNGNIIFILNRMELIEPEEREEVIEYAKVSLMGMGNNFVGKSELFPIDSKTVLDYKCGQIGENSEQYLEEILAFESWLQVVFNSLRGQKIAMLSRLGILDNYLQQAYAYFQVKIDETKTTLKELEEQAQEDLRQRQQNFNQLIFELKAQLLEVKNELSKEGENFVTTFMREVKFLIDNDDPQWVTKLQTEWFNVCQKFFKKIQTKTKEALNQLPLPIPQIKSKNFTNLSQINIDKDLGTNIADLIGGGFALASSRWLSKNLLGIDLKQENLDQVTKTVNEHFSIFKIDLEHYFKDLESLINSYHKSHRPILNIPQVMIQTKLILRRYEELIIWCKNCQFTISQIKEKIMKNSETKNQLLSEFEEQWTNFEKLVNGDFINKYEKQKGWFTPKPSLTPIINEIIQQRITPWNDINHYNGAWFNILQRQHTNLAPKFKTVLQSIKIENPLNSRKRIGTSEIIICSIAILISLAILLWWQNLDHIILGDILINQFILSVTVIFIGLSLANAKKEKREQEEKEKITQEFMKDLDEYKKKLKQILLQVN